MVRIAKEERLEHRDQMRNSPSDGLSISRFVPKSLSMELADICLTLHSYGLRVNATTLVLQLYLARSIKRACCTVVDIMYNGQ